MYNRRKNVGDVFVVFLVLFVCVFYIFFPHLTIGFTFGAIKCEVKQIFLRGFAINIKQRIQKKKRSSLFCKRKKIIQSKAEQNCEPLKPTGKKTR